MTRMVLGIAIVALTIFAGNFTGARAEQFMQCSQRYFRAHAACVKNNDRAQCDRVIGNRKAACMRTGCWQTTRNKTCGLSRL